MTLACGERSTRGCRLAAETAAAQCHSTRFEGGLERTYSASIRTASSQPSWPRHRRSASLNRCLHATPSVPSSRAASSSSSCCWPRGWPRRRAPSWTRSARSGSCAAASAARRAGRRAPSEESASSTPTSLLLPDAQPQLAAASCRAVGSVCMHVQRCRTGSRTRLSRVRISKEFTRASDGLQGSDLNRHDTDAHTPHAHPHVSRPAHATRHTHARPTTTRTESQPCDDQSNPLEASTGLETHAAHL